MRDVTLVLMTCGELTESECLDAASPFFDNGCEFAEVRNVTPQIIALNQMIDSVRTEFFIPLDADMVLSGNAYRRVRNGLSKNRHRSDWHSILWPLWDTLTERKILALKLLRTSCMKSNPFRESATPDVEHYGRLTKEGYVCIHDYLKQEPIGRHVVRGPRFCYHKLRDVYQTLRSHQFEWDSGVFLGGDDLKSRAKCHFDYFLRKWIATSDDDYLHCISGMMDGILSPSENRSKVLDDTPLAISIEAGFHLFCDWYYGSAAARLSSQFL